MTTARLTTYALLIAGAAGLGLPACSNPSQNETGTPYVPDDERYPGNDNGKELPTAGVLSREDSGQLSTTTIGTVNSYDGDDAGEPGEGIYDASVGAESDNPNFSNEAQGLGNDPVTPNAPLADGTAGQPDAADLPTGRSARAQAGGGTDGNQLGQRAATDRPYGNNMEPRDQPGMATRIDTGSYLGEKAYVAAATAANLPVFVPGGDLDAYVSQSYGAGPRNSPTEQPGGDQYEVSTYRPPVSDVAAATYANTQSKLVAKPGSQNYLVYQPVQLKIVPQRPWNAPAAVGDDDDDRYAEAYLGNDCEGADDRVACSSGAFDEIVAPLLNDQRVARSIASGQVDGFHFELDARGRVDPGSVEVKTGAATCNTDDCTRLRRLLAGALLPLRWNPAYLYDQPVAARVIVPLRRDVRLVGETPNTP